ncbi:MAG TPA: TldD/PmbA family protein, partial [Haliangium sp.]|nr:TldD/PmbA family protein [Haliangium sp.]
MIDRERARAVTDAVLALSKADEARVELTESEVTHLRFANNAPSTSGTYTEPALTIWSSFGKRTGSVSVTQLDEASLAQAVRRSEELARLAPEDPEHVPVLGPQAFSDTPAFDADTAERGAEVLAEGVGRCVEDARKAGLEAAGFTETVAEAQVIASSRGLFGYHRNTRAYVSETARTPDGSGSGWASAADHRIAEIDYGAVSRTAVAKAQASQAPRPLPPGEYVTILEPACVANLLQLMTFFMNARNADEGRSYFASPKGGNRRGETLFPDNVHIYSDPQDPLAPAAPWGADGLPQQRRDWIAGGKLANLYVERFWADKQGVEPIPRPSNLIMRGGKSSVDDLVASTKRGLLVTSMWYIRFVDPRSLLFTGLTRDGVFWIENGKIQYPVQNFRWNESPIHLLKHIEGM